MAGLRDTLETKGKKKITVHVNEIRTNKLNQYPMDDIEELALQFLEMKEQIQPGEAYQDDLHDGKRFTLTSGERRYRAIKLLYSRGEHDGMMDLIIVNKPQDIWEERRRIRAANVYRTHSQETRLMEIKECEEEYRHLIEIEQKPKGLKRDWIAAQLGISGRTVDRYLKDPKSSQPEAEEKKNEDEKDTLHMQSCAQRLESKFQTKATIKGHRINIYFQDTEDLNRILELMDALDQGVS